MIPEQSIPLHEQISDLPLLDLSDFKPGEVITSDPSFAPLLRARAVLDQPALGSVIGEPRPKLLWLAGPHCSDRSFPVKWLAASVARPARVVSVFDQNIFEMGWHNLSEYLSDPACLTILYISATDKALLGQPEFSPDASVRRCARAARAAVEKMAADPDLLVCLEVSSNDPKPPWIRKLLTGEVRLGNENASTVQAFLERQMGGLKFTSPPDWDLLSYVGEDALDSLECGSGLGRLAAVAERLRKSARNRGRGLDVMDVVAALRFPQYRFNDYHYAPGVKDAKPFRRHNAIHEAGHAAVTLCLFGPVCVEYADSIIIADNKVAWCGAGRVSSSVASDRIYDESVDPLGLEAVRTAGRLSEQMILGEATGGCASDYVSLRSSLLRRLCLSLKRDLDDPDGPLSTIAGLPPEVLDQELMSAAMAGVERFEREASAIAGTILFSNRAPIEHFAETVMREGVLFGPKLQAVIDASGFVTPAGDPIRSDVEYVIPSFNLGRRDITDELTGRLLARIEEYRAEQGA